MVDSYNNKQLSLIYELKLKMFPVSILLSSTLYFKKLSCFTVLQSFNDFIFIVTNINIFCFVYLSLNAIQI